MRLLINVQCVMSLDISYVMAKGKKFLIKCCVIFPQPRLQRLFMSRHISLDMSWHKEKRIRHPANSKAWKDMDTQFP